MQVNALLIYNGDKQFPIKVKFYFGLGLGLEVQLNCCLFTLVW